MHSETRHDAEWDRLFDVLASEYVSLSESVSERMRDELPAYAGISVQELRASVLMELHRVMESARTGRAAVSERELKELAAIGASRARKAVPVDEMLRAWRIAIQMVVSRARVLGAELEISDRALLEFVESILAWADVAMVVTAAAHRKAELALAREDQERRGAFVRGLLQGTITLAEAQLQAGQHGLDRTREYVAVRAQPPAGGDTARLERALGLSLAGGSGRGMCTMIDGDLAGFLPEPPAGELDGLAGVGAPRPIERLSESFRLATRAVTTARAFGLSGIHDVAGLGLRAAIVADADVGDALSVRYLDPLRREPSGEELITSVRAYFECGMHVERAASRLFVHQNTLRYRIGRFESLTDSSLRDPTTAFAVWWALERDVAAPSLEPGPKTGS